MIKKFKEYIKESLLDKLEGPTIDDALNNNPTKVLQYAINSNNDELIKKSIEYGADINFNDGYLLKYYSEKGNLERVKFYVENGADVNYGDSVTQLPIVKAARNGHADIVKYLLDNGACTDVYERDLKQALIWAKSNIKITETPEKIQEYRDIIKYLEDFQWGPDIF